MHTLIILTPTRIPTLIQQGKEGDAEALALPDGEAEAAAAEKTRNALAGIIGAKVASAKPFMIGQSAHTKEAKFIQ